MQSPRVSVMARSLFAPQWFPIFGHGLFENARRMFNEEIQIVLVCDLHTPLKIAVAFDAYVRRHYNISIAQACFDSFQLG